VESTSRVITTGIGVGPGTTLISSNFLSGNRYESIVEDQGHSWLVGNNVSGSATAAILVISYNGNTQDSVATVTHNFMSGNTVALLNETDGVSTHTSTATGTSNTFTNDTQGVVNKTENVLNFAKNWWGNSSGPSDWAVGTGDSVSDDVTFFPWSTNVGNSTFAACTLKGPKAGNATLVGKAGVNNIICARGSNNLLVGRGATDLLIGSTGGNDTLVAGSGPTTMIGLGPNDTLDGGAGRDSMEAPAPATCQGGGPGTQMDCTGP
jgi:Ca2+-binding RTX toxin-like protein